MSFFRALNRNLPYIRQQFGALLGNTSASVKTICGIVLFSYCLSYSENAVKIISVTPGLLMPPAFWLWTAFTFCFLEIYFWEVIIDIVTVGLCGKLIEPLWGQMEMMSFFAIVNFGVAVITTIFYLILFAFTSNDELLFEVHIHGLAGYLAGVSVAVKQIMPDLVIVKTPLGKLSNRNVPLTAFFGSLVCWLIGLLDGTYPTMFLSGLIVSWIYLRFYQKHSNGTRGDMADYFNFASFFPNVIQPPVHVISNSIYSILVKIGLCRKVVRKYDIANPTGVMIVPGIEQQDVERRRQIALKALSERLSKYQQDKQPLLPKSTKDLKPDLLSNTPTQPPAPSHVPPATSSSQELKTVIVDDVNNGASTSFMPPPTIL
ncbi:hypothetical protein WA026_023119 [Henosepilachna vigintioctopunctata]|uniref:Transmembrane protein 115 n=1 Tax=Henosepilachna vigintioctopunctata TaxID=420089 RepID=A0AAW1UCJ4_9CUCU